MNHQTFSTRIAPVVSLLGLIFCFCFVSARAQELIPFVDCIERETNGSGAYTGDYIVYFGYNVTTTTTYTIPYKTGSNFYSPSTAPVLNPPTVFFPGVHRRVVAVKIPAVDPGLTWFLGTSYATVYEYDTPNCNGESANSRLITYQGRLTDGAAAANGVYDLQFQLFNAATGGAARTTLIALEDVLVTNGIFTVQLDLGANSLPAGNVETTAVNRALNPAILDAENSFFEISVRAGTSTGAYTTLTPRQPLTAVPLAMRAESATTAYRAATADNAAMLGGVWARSFVQTNDSRLSNARTPTAGSNNYIQNTTARQTGNFNVSGGGTIGGTLTADTISADSPNSYPLNARSSSLIGTWLTLGNTTTGGRNWGIISSGANNTEGAGKLLFRDTATNTVPLQISGGGVNIVGNLTVSGAISGATKNFTIDHPLDPANKTLTYTSIESPDMKNIYDGNVTTDQGGEAVVQMPAYFSALNRDFRYQLTVIGTFARAIVAAEITNNQFVIRTDQPNVKVSWQVTGIRRDRFAEDQRPKIEADKPARERGKCLYAPACAAKQP